MGMCPIGRSKEIEWSLTSKKEPRWNKKGTSTVAMMFQQAPEATRHINKLQKKYGYIPVDLTYEAHKI